MLLYTKIKIKNTTMAVIISIAAILIPSYFLNKMVEGLFFFICHWLIREQFPHQYHCTTHSACRFLTSVIFFFGVCMSFPIEYSFMSAIPICYFIGFAGNEEYERLKSSINKPIKTKFNCSTCTEQELLQRCMELNFSEENKQLCIEFFIKKTKQSKIADELCINEKSVTKRKDRLKDKLEA